MVKQGTIGIFIAIFLIMATSQQEYTLEELKGMRKADLKGVAESLEINITSSMRKADIIQQLAAKLNLEYPEKISESDVKERQDIELAKIELERERNILKKEMEILRAEREGAREQYEIRRLELELQIKKESQSKSSVRDVKVEPDFDVTKYIKLVPKFSENEVDTYFLAFEKIANRLEWPVRYWTILLQSVLVGKAQEVFSSLSDDQSQDYELVKKSILSAYELVPEAYRQRFRTLKRQHGQTYVEYARAKEIIFDKWYRSMQKDKTFDNLRELMLMEEFKNSIPIDIKTHLNEHKVCDIKQAAVISDDYELTHKKDSVPFIPKWFKNKDNNNQNFELETSRSNNEILRARQSYYDRKRRRPWFGKRPTCHYCGKVGHIKPRCFKLLRDEKKKFAAKPVAFVNIAAHPNDSFNNQLKGVPSSSVFESKATRTNRHTDIMPEGYRDYISQGEVNSISSNESKPVVILRDTGAAQSLMLSAALPNEFNTPPKSSVLVKGIDGNYTPVPLYKIHLKSSLVSGPVIVGVVNNLPIDGIDLLLGNDLAGNKVRASPIVTAEPSVEVQTESLATEYPGIFPACVLTRSMTRKESLDNIAPKRAPEDEFWLAETFFKNLNENNENHITASSKVVFNKHLLDKEQEADHTLHDVLVNACTEDEATTSFIVQFPTPTNKRELMRFLGMSGFYRKFCANYSTIAAPLTDLLKKGVKFVWSDSCHESFNKIKALLINEPILQAPDFKKLLNWPSTQVTLPLEAFCCKMMTME